MKKIIAALSVSILILTHSAFAADKTFIKEYIYLASDLDSKVSSRAIALEQVKRALLEELGTYLISETRVKDFQLTKDQITTDAFSKAIELDPKNWYAYHGRGIAYNISGKYQQAIDDYTKLIDLNPKEWSWYESRGNAYKEFGKYQEAIDDYTKVIELHPKDKYWYASAYADRGRAYNRLDDYEPAIADFTKQIELYPKGADGYRNRGIVYEKWGKTEQATADFKMAARLGDKMAQEVLKTRGIAWE